ncbi:ABC transporter substrate-binding protein [Kribbella italica]|uniref:Multiple sugar transport system substrate-binding protein n=1 Tax=Kribbella italica TaxID=1540520 RepID=A0A7W9J4V7_9ACTN|nr:sugar ABC transporter substrate-binding protein [Kribbella italica]MBB5834928.1 multiple sugar transport system substrate-binding protein [Kribbella italica]
MIGQTRLSRRQLFRTGGAAALAAGLGSTALAGCGDGAGGSGGGSDLTFMYWGSAFEKKAIDEMLKKYAKDHDGATIDPMFVPVSNYPTKVSSLVAANTPPDLGYLGTSQMYDLAQKDLILNLFPYLDKYPDLKDRLPSSYFWYGKDKLAANQLAMGVQILYYNTDAFAAAGLDPAPFTAQTAWSWDDFVQAADKLTVDQNGKHPSEDGFDSGKVKQFGTIAPFGGGGLYSLLRSNGADVVNADGTKFALDSAAAVDVLQKIQDLIYVHRVAPTPAQLGKNAPTSSVQLQTKRIGMLIDGNWQMLDLMEGKVPFGVGVLPKFQESLTMTGGAAGAIFAKTKQPEEAIELYLYYNDPAHVDLFKDGLWAPLQKKYYTDQAEIDKWVLKDKYPANFQTAVVETTLEHGVTDWGQQMKNSERIHQVFDPAIEQVSLNKGAPIDIVKALKPKMQPLLQGKWPTQEL